MICAGMQPLMHHAQAHPWKLYQRYCYVIRIYQPLKGIWAKSLMLRPCGGLTICMGDFIYGRAEAFLWPGYFKELVPKSSVEMVSIIFQVREYSPFG
jgi:hypothetical protein